MPNDCLAFALEQRLELGLERPFALELGSRVPGLLEHLLHATLKLDPLSLGNRQSGENLVSDCLEPRLPGGGIGEGPLQLGQALSGTGEVGVGALLLAASVLELPAQRLRPGGALDRDSALLLQLGQRGAPLGSEVFGLLPSALEPGLELAPHLRGPGLSLARGGQERLGLRFELGHSPGDVPRVSLEGLVALLEGDELSPGDVALLNQLLLARHEDGELASHVAGRLIELVLERGQGAGSLGLVPGLCLRGGLQVGSRGDGGLLQAPLGVDQRLSLPREGRVLLMGELGQLGRVADPEAFDLRAQRRRAPFELLPLAGLLGPGALDGRGSLLEPSQLALELGDLGLVPLPGSALGGDRRGEVELETPGASDLVVLGALELSHLIGELLNVVGAVGEPSLVLVGQIAKVPLGAGQGLHVAERPGMGCLGGLKLGLAPGQLGLAIFELGEERRHVGALSLELGDDVEALLLF